MPEQSVAANADIKKQNTFYYLKVLLFFLILFSVGLLPPFAQITPLGMDILGIFCALIFGWIFLEMGWTSIVGLIAIGLTDYATVTTAFTTGFGYYLVATLFGSFMFAGILDYTGLTKFMANWLMTRKFVIGRPYVLFFMILLTVEVIGTLASGYAACFIIWSMFLQMCSTAGYNKTEKFVPFMLCCILFIAMFSGVVLPFKSGGVMYIGFFTQATGLGMNDIAFMLISILIVTLTVVALILTLKYIIRPDLGNFANLGDIFGELRGQKMTQMQKYGLIALAIFIAILLLPSFLPSDLAFVKLINNLGVLGMSFIMVAVFSIIKDENGKHLATISEIHNKISWDVVWLIMCTVPLAAAMEADSTGIMASFMAAVTPLLSGLSPMVFAIVVFLFITLSTQIVHNLLLVIIFVPIACPLMIELGGNPYIVFFLIYWGSCLAYLTPAASMTAALMHGHPDVPPKSAYFSGLIFMVTGMIICPLVIIPICNIFFAM